MLKKPFSKLLSVLLTIAICATTVFGCFVTVTAEQNKPSYVITGAQCETGDTVASAFVTFNVPNGACVGSFTIENQGNWYSSVAVSRYSELAATDDNFVIDNDNGNVLLTITDSNDNAKLYTTFVLKLDFVFSGAGITDDINISISNLEFNGIYSDEIYTDFVNNSTNAKFTAGCQHKFVVNGEAVYSSNEFDYTVYPSATCSVCGEVKNEYQVALDGEKGGEIVAYSGSASAAPAVSLLDPNSPNSESNPYIIEYPTQVHALAMGALKNSAGEELYDDNAYFRVKDGIKAFVMQTSEHVNAVMNLSSPEEVFEYFDSASSLTTWWTSFGTSKGKVACHFDGNGVEIYGINSVYKINPSTSYAPAIFPVVTGNSSFKNFTVKNSNISANSGAGVAILVGKTLDDDKTDLITIENCALIGNYVAQTGNHQAGASAFAGTIQKDVDNADDRDSIIINNCLVYNNVFDNSVYETANTGSIPKSGLVTDGGHNPNFKISNVISLGVTPWTINASGWYHKQIANGNYKNIYTDATQAQWDAFASSNNNNTAANATNFNINYALDTNSFKGDAAATTATALDWNSDANPNGVWFTGLGNQFPTLLKKASVAVAGSTDNDWKLLGVNLVYKNNGGFAINFHYEPAYDADVKLYLTSAANDGKVMILDKPTTSSLAGSVLPTGTKMFTVDNLSARDIDVLWLATIVTDSEDGSCKVYGETKQISISKYAEDVVCGNAFYDENATETNKIADKTVAAALINYGLASNSALSVDSAQTGTIATIVEKWDQYENGKYVGWYNGNLSGLGTKESPLIIDTAEKLAWVCKETTVGNSAGVYYKVADNIKAFDMNTVAGVDLTDESLTANEVYDKINGKVLGKVWHPNYAGCFAGNFDGNGVTIYGLYAGPAYYNPDSLANNNPLGCEYAALFGKIDASTATFKNFTIKNSYFTGGNYGSAGAVFGTTLLNGGSAVIENVVVANSYFKSNYNQLSAGVLVGLCSYDTNNKIIDKVLINNCFVYDNVVVNKTGEAARLIGKVENWHPTGTVDGGNNKYFNPEYFKISNTVAIGCNIEKNNYWANNASFYTNCYTTEITGSTANTITKLSSADAAKGVAAKVNMPSLDWDNVWMYGNEGEYPSLVLSKAKPEKVKGTISIRSQTNESQPFVLLDPSKPNSESNPYLVETAAQMYMLLRGVAKDASGNNISTTGSSNYFKVADGIDAFYLAGADLAALDNVDDVKAWFENAANTDFKKIWTGTFSGHFDGNGVEIYGARSDDSLAGLFPQISGESSIKNFTVKNSYLKGSSGAAGLVGKKVKDDSSKLTIENCKIINCYIDSGKNGGNAGAASLVGFSYDSPIVANNVLIYGNKFVNVADQAYGITSYGNYVAGTSFTNIISIGYEPYRVGGNTNVNNLVYSGVYTDMPVNSVYSQKDIKQLTVAEMQGPNAVTNMPNLAWAKNGGVWYAGAIGDYPGFEEVGFMPSNIQSQYDNLVFTLSDKSGSNTEYTANGSMSFGVYQTALSLKANPYMSFAFAFLGEYKTNRDKIKIRFTYTENGTTKTSDEISVPAYTGEDIKNVNGWTNTTANGRYHTYKAENIPVEALAYGIKIEASYNGGAWADFGTYSVSGLGQQFERLNRSTPCEYYDTRVEATKALLFYAQAIAARYGA